MREGVAAYAATGARLWRLYYLALIAETHSKVARVEDGLADLAEALDLVQSTGEREHEAELYRLRGELTLKQSPFPSPDFANQKAAEQCFHCAIDIAHRQQAKSLELRAAISLARLWQQQGKPKEAHAMLADIYTWFTEGFDTADLKDAKVLLEELGGTGA